MKKKKIVKAVILTVFIFLICFFLYNFITRLRLGKQTIILNTSTQIYSDSNIEAIIDVCDKKNNSIKSNVCIELLDSNGKKVKDINEKYKKEEEEKIQAIIPLSKDIQTGSYELKVTSKYKFGFFKDSVNVPVNIINGSDSRIIISLDKGIYKPGDNVNFRALLISKRNENPIETKANIYIYDGNDNKVYSNEAETSKYGIISGNFKLGDEVNSGTYKLVVSTDSKAVTQNFIVNPYITPQFEVSVISDKENYTVGENAKVTVNAKYFFGEPVKNATVEGTIDGQKIKGTTNENGNFETTYKFKEKGKVSLKFNVTDPSNYLIEAEKILIANSEKFEIEVLPEYGALINKFTNEVYIFTRNNNGEPLKTQNTITIGNIKRQVITDENGIGSFTLTGNDVSGLKSSVSYDSTMLIQSEDSEGRTVFQKQAIDFKEWDGTLIETDKVKYNCGEDINIKLISNILSIEPKEVFIYKGNELLKVVSSKNMNFSVNLENVSGLIDIYTPKVTQNERRNYTPIYNYEIGQNIESNKYSKKTVFIKPNKALNIDITTDSENYKPKDKLNIEFKTTDEKNNSIDSALLVSILDEAVLKLAENDLSIDNIKLALEDIKLSDEITLADLYANILDESSEQMLKTVLLRQDYGTPNIYTKAQTTSYEEIDKYEERAVYSCIAIVIFVLIFAIIKSSKNENNKFSKFIANTVNLFIIFVLVAGLLYSPILELYYEILDSYETVEVLDLITNAVIAFVLYMLVLYKHRDYIFELIINLIIIPAIYLLIFSLIVSISGEEAILILILLILFVLWAILVNKSKSHELSGKENFLKYTLTQVFKTIVLVIATMLVSELIDSILGLYIVLAVYIIVDKYVLGKTKIKLEGNKINLNTSGNELIVAGVGILFIVIIFVGIRGIVSNFAGNVTIDNSTFLTESITDDFNGNTRAPLSYSDVTESSIVAKGDSPSITNIFDDNKKQKNEVDQIVNETNEDNNFEKTVEEIENVRNVFLESLAFIPELVTENGNANLSLDISDNITTWNIQTVGNSKNGNIGYSSKTFKVFKEFFVDFSLPTNSVVTDKVEIPVTLYNYTDSTLNIEINVKENDWSIIGEYHKTIEVPAKSNNMIYVPIEIIKSGNNTLRVETKSGDISDIVEKNITVNENGLKIEELVSSGTTESDLSQDIIYSEKAIEGTKNLKVKLYASSIVQAIENIEGMLELPTGCFEQTSSSLYPDILVLKYLKNNNLDKQEIKEKALDYISKGYQRLLTFEVNGTKGGYSLYGDSPAEPVITAFGLMEVKELSEVYNVDENVIKNMTNYLFSVQNINGSFDYNSTYIGGSESRDELAMNAYIIWALSEAIPEDARLSKSINYLKDKIDKAEDNYTLALMANVFTNIEDTTNSNKVLNKLLKNIVSSEDSAYIESTIKDYYGSYGRYQSIQTTALTSLALTRSNSSSKTNQALINYLINTKSSNGTWGTTQSTVLALKAINEYSQNSDTSEQTITVKVNDQVKSVDIDKNNLDLYEFNFENLSDENKVSIEMKKGKISYEIVKEYYRDYNEVQFEKEMDSSNKIIAEQSITQITNVNNIVTQNIRVINKTNEDISNGLVQINIPQGCSVNEDSLMMLKHNQVIEKYEYNYGKINLYLRDFQKNSEINLEVKYRALYPEVITGGAVRIYDYYNPEIEAICKPNLITINK